MSKRADLLRRYYGGYRFYSNLRQDAPIRFEGVRKKTYSEAAGEFAFTCTAITQDDKLLASVSDDKIVLERETLWAIVNYPATMYLLKRTLWQLQESNLETKDANKRLDALRRNYAQSQLDNTSNEFKLAGLKRELDHERGKVKRLEAQMTSVIVNELKGIPITLESDNVRFTIEFQDEA